MAVAIPVSTAFRCHRFGEWSPDGEWLVLRHGGRRHRRDSRDDYYDVGPDDRRFLMGRIISDWNGRWDGQPIASVTPIVPSLLFMPR